MYKTETLDFVKIQKVIKNYQNKLSLEFVKFSIYDDLSSSFTDNHKAIKEFKTIEDLNKFLKAEDILISIDNECKKCGSLQSTEMRNCSADKDFECNCCLDCRNECANVEHDDIKCVACKNQICNCK